ncbi:hypothetical protein [Desulfurella sp.]|uniref:hypothetical protein n=1 Tax=Desulfurella sp. TaxID=1962857 RepID=UPI0025BDBD83|nr:hypothetical protein [Desulfurella sp.]
MRETIAKKFEKLPKTETKEHVTQKYKCKICGKVVKRKERVPHYNTHRIDKKLKR